MYKIFIDSAKRYEKSVKLVKIENGKKTIIAGKTGDLDITVEIKKLLVSNNLDVSDIGEFDSNLGPGSFTGLKIGVTVANILNWACGIKDISQLDIPNYGAEPNIDKSGLISKK